ncbi:hypothetical protein SVAN01_04377 [Stagonosporopsis vannaccii]|nr:hypothetical protein SVAN01_04377 [Stagonosporopsis vannaccii]
MSGPYASALCRWWAQALQNKGTSVPALAPHEHRLSPLLSRDSPRQGTAAELLGAIGICVLRSMAEEWMAMAGRPRDSGAIPSRLPIAP